MSLILLACNSNTNIKTNSLKADSILQTQHVIKDTTRKSNFDSLYYKHSKAFTILDTTNNETTWRTFMSGIKKCSTDSLNRLLSYGAYCCFDKQVTAYDYKSYLESDSGRIFSHRIICKQFDLTQKNELGFLTKFFMKGLKIKIPTLKGFDKPYNYWSGMLENEEPLVCVHYNVNLKNIKPQNFYLLFLQTSESTGFGSENWFCTFDNKGNLIDCVFGTFGSQWGNCVVDFDKNENIRGKYEEYSRNGDNYVYSFEYVIKITKEGKFKVIKTSKKKVN